MKKDNIVEVIWRDSNMYLTQCGKDDYFTYETLTSYGKVIQEDDEQIVLAGDTLGEDVRRVIVIPTENIITIKKFNLNK